MSGATFAFGPQRGEVNWSNHDLLAGPGVSLTQNSTVIVDYHAPSWPAERRIVLCLRSLIAGDDVRQVLQRAASVHHRPPVHGRRRAPRVHVRRHTNQHLGPSECELPDRFGEEPIVANRRAQATDFRLGYMIDWLLVIRYVMRAGVDFPRYPRMHLAKSVENSAGSHQATRVEHLAGVTVVAF